MKTSYPTAVIVNEPLKIMLYIHVYMYIQIQNISKLNEILYPEGMTQFLLQLHFVRQFIVLWNMHLFTAESWLIHVDLITSVYLTWSTYLPLKSGPIIFQELPQLFQDTFVVASVVSEVPFHRPRLQSWKPIIHVIFKLYINFFMLHMYEYY